MQDIRIYPPARTDANWSGRTPRTLAESKFGAGGQWKGYDNKVRPTAWDMIGIALFVAAMALFVFVGFRIF